MTPSGLTEDALVEQPAIKLLGELGWETANCFDEFASGQSTLGRATDAEVVLVSRLRPALENLNPSLPTEAITLAIDELTRDRGKMSPAAANREVYRLLKDGVKVTFKSADGDDVTETVKLINWTEPRENDFFLASQFWVSGEMYKRRADLVGFVNGIPLLFCELKAVHRALKNAYDGNLRDYKTAIPQLFWFNGLIILSNGSATRIGSLTALWEHFAEWKRINSEGEKGVVSLETMLRGTCEPERFLDLVENFTLFMEAGGGLIKLTGKNHQYLGVNNSIDVLKKIGKNKRQLGVFWHTQGSGKSVSMIFFAQKVLRKMAGNWTFVIVTDRQELDDQIYKNFADAGVITEKQAQAGSGKELQQLLMEDHRYIFTLIQKFHTEKGQKYPKLSDRSDIIVITDEAHRSQYDIFAMNMRTALPEAAFIGFTGTPLMIGEEKTRQVFGDYVSIYNFQQSIEDGATVPLFYENRIPELQLTNQDLNTDMEALLEAAELDEEQEKKLEREFARQYHLITRDDRLERIAEDLVAHYMGRDFSGSLGPGKAMVVCIDKATAVRMYDKVQKYWKVYLKKLQADLKTTAPAIRPVIEEKIKFMRTMDMAVVVSQSQNEVEEMKKKGVDIVPHRKRMVAEDMDKKFKDSDDPFRMVFVCAMWMTGFDVPSCSTIYLDKPMRNHTLMQTIARANRVFPDKVNGLIVDYVGVFRDLQKALAIYAPRPGDAERPIKDKAELVEMLKAAIAEAKSFLGTRGVDIDAMLQSKAFAKVAMIEDAAKAIVLKEAKAFEGTLDDTVEAVLVNDESKRKFRQLADNVARVFRAIKPDPLVNEFLPACALIAVIAEKIRSLTRQADISKVMADVETLLDDSIAAEGYLISGQKSIDLSKIDFEKLKAQFERGRKRIEAEKLRGAVNSKLKAMVRLNRSRLDYHEKFQQLIEEYNAGCMNIEEFFDRLVKFARGLNQEEQRGIAEGLSEEELAVFDLLTRPELKLAKKEEQQVKKVAKELLETLKNEKLVLDWRKKQQTRAAVRLSIEQAFDRLPAAFTPVIYQQKCQQVYQHVYDSYFGQGVSVYQAVA
ncbi:MAG: type I restriction endonuclease subunit R [Phycisphaeraceae bacterium]|nr:type I restriction endonuclease subunit R [Phycisphaeraceae bacterium]